MATFELASAVVGLVGEAVGAGVTGGRGVGERPVAVERDRAVARVADQDGRSVVAGIRIGVVGQHAPLLVIREVEVDLAGERSGRAVAELREAGRERDDVARGVVDRLGHRELAGDHVGPPAIAADVQAGGSGRLERVSRCAGVGPGHEPARARGREAERPRLAGRGDGDLHAARDDAVPDGARGDGAVSRREVVGLPLADEVSTLAVHRHGRLGRRGGQRRVRGVAIRVVLGNRVIEDIQGDRGDVRVELAVAVLVGEAVDAGEVGRRRVGERAIGVEGQRGHASAWRGSAQVRGLPLGSVSLASTPGAATEQHRVLVR